MMEKMFFKMVDERCKDCMVYTHKDDMWLINPHTREWIISYFPKTKYAWWNYDFFETVYNFLCMDIDKEQQPIRNWIESRMNIEIGKNCEPDMLPGQYDWSGDFKTEDVILNGIVFSS